MATPTPLNLPLGAPNPGLLVRLGSRAQQVPPTSEGPAPSGRSDAPAPLFPAGLSPLYNSPELPFTLPAFRLACVLPTPPP